MELTTYKIHIKGVVQGVGFRPFVYSLAKALALKGEVSNDASGVDIMINTGNETLAYFIQKLKSDAPTLSHIDAVTAEVCISKNFDTFSIVDSKPSAEIGTLIPPDISICKTCQHELNDKNDRRYGYPFITCTDCGVRYSIIHTLPSV